jgi:putative transposase
MPRKSRIVISGYPHHIIQRGHNRQVVFVSDDDYLYYLDNLGEWKEKLGCRVYAYCLMMMTNHIHLIVDPGIEEGSLGKKGGHNTNYWLLCDYLEEYEGGFF